MNQDASNNSSFYNCCCDWYKFVFPYFSPRLKKIVGNKNSIPPGVAFSNDLHGNVLIYNEYGEIEKVPENSTIHIDLDEFVPHPGFHEEFFEEEDLSTIDNQCGCWSLERIRSTIEHWFKLSHFYNGEPLNILHTNNFEKIIVYDEGIEFGFGGKTMNVCEIDNHIKKKVLAERPTCVFELSGKGCRKLESLGINLLSMLERLYEIPGCRCTRFDFALDAINSNFSMFELQNLLLSDRRQWTGTYQRARAINDYQVSGESLIKKGNTIQFGSKASTSQFNIYDKKEERIENAGIQIDADSWIRFELQSFKDKADRLVKTMIIYLKENSYNQFVVSLIKKHINIKICENINNDPNFRPGKVKTWPTLPKWDDLLGDVDKILLQPQDVFEETLIRKKNWYNTSVVPTACKLDAIYNLIPEAKIDTLEAQINYWENITADELNLLNDFLIKSGSSKKYTTQDIQSFINDLKDEILILQKK